MTYYQHTTLFLYQFSETIPQTTFSPASTYSPFLFRTPTDALPLTLMSKDTHNPHRTSTHRDRSATQSERCCRRRSSCTVPCHRLSCGTEPGDCSGAGHTRRRSCPAPLRSNRCPPTPAAVGILTARENQRETYMHAPHIASRVRVDSLLQATRRAAPCERQLAIPRPRIYYDNKKHNAKQRASGEPIKHVQLTTAACSTTPGQTLPSTRQSTNHALMISLPSK
jgi:hypothetical protein